MAATPDDRRRLPLNTLLAASAISFVGSVLTNLAVPWFVLVTTGSAARTGLVVFFSVLPGIIAGFFGGAIVDRLGYKRTSIASDLASGVTVALIPLLYHTVGLAFWQLLALSFLGALLDAPGSTARLALIPDLAETAEMRLERATSAAQAIASGARLLGGPLAGLLIAWLGPSNVLWLDAASFAISATLVALAVPPAGRRAATAPGKSYWTELADGARFIRDDRLIRAIVLTVLITNFLDAPMLSVIMPVYARWHFGSAVDLGLLFAANAAGTLVGTIAFGAVGHRLPRRATFAGAFIGAGLPFWALAALPPLPVAAAALAVGGLSAGPLNPLLTTVAFERIPAGLRGRVFGTLVAGAHVAIPLGVLAAGYLLEWLGARATLVGLGACLLAVTSSILIVPAFREMDAARNGTTVAGEARTKVE